MMVDNGSVEVRLSIGDFSRMTHLSIKALRHYHEVGLLEPAAIDPSSAYRYYEPEQVATAQVIRRFRDLGMPVDEIKAVLAAPDVAGRNQVIMSHLARMQDELERTEATVSSLRALLDARPVTLEVEYRSAPATPSLAVAETVKAEDALEWWFGAFDDLYDTAQGLGLEPAGAGGALFPGEFYEVEQADLVAYVPLASAAPEARGRVEPYVVPAAELAVALHRGAFEEIDRTYGALGLHVAERAIGVDGPIREHYLVSPRDTSDGDEFRIEVCWPIFQTT
jgi:DNA-binding transcriptional MerR regulator/effector-binding domain-containing protein